MGNLREERDGFDHDLPLHQKVFPAPRMGFARLENRPHQFLAAHFATGPFAETLHMPGAEAAEFDRLVGECANIILHPHDMGMRLRVDGPQFPDVLPPDRRKETGAVPRFGAVMPDGAFEPGQTFAVVAPAVGVADGDPRIEGVDDPQPFQLFFDEKKFRLISTGPLQRGVSVGELLRVDFDDHLVDPESGSETAELIQHLLKIPWREGTAQRIPHLTGVDVVHCSFSLYCFFQL